MQEASNAAQLNARLDRRLKEDGDSALASIGLTPSAAIRALWAKAAKRGKDLEEVRVLLYGETDRDAAAGERVRTFEAGRRGIARGMREMGITDLSTPTTIGDAEMLAYARMKQAGERGIL